MIIYNNIPLGTVVTGYYKGYFKVLRYEERQNISPLAYLSKIGGVDFTPTSRTARKREYCCDAAYLKKVEIWELEHVAGYIERLICEVNGETLC